MQDSTTDRYLSYLQSEIVIRSSHQNQKERTAWLATIFFIGLLPTAFYKLEPILTGFLGKAFGCAFLISFAACTLVFVATQFMVRWEDVEIATACKKAIIELIKEPDGLKKYENIDVTDWSNSESKTKLKRFSFSKTYPNIVTTKITNSWEFVMPWYWLGFFYKHDQLSARKVLESVSYTFILLTTLSILALVL